jgi:hypothetical protein
MAENKLYQKQSNYVIQLLNKNNSFFQGVLFLYKKSLPDCSTFIEITTLNSQINTLNLISNKN